jgi:flagellar biosynthesis protein FlhF
MPIRKFRAANISQAIQLVKGEMGPDAVILALRNVSSGLKTELEITASREDQPEPKAAPKSEPGARQAATAESGDDPLAQLHRDLGGIRRRIDELEDRLPIDAWNQRLDGMTAEFAELKGIIRDLLLDRGRADAKHTLLFEGDLAELHQRLRLSGVNESHARELIEQTAAELAARQLPISAHGLEYLARNLMGRVRVTQPFQPAREQRVHMVVGPTGVGKTTTIAKLAAQQVFELSQTVALLTVDTFRIGAIDQLRTYARILDVPLEVCLSPVELVEAVRRHAEKDMLFVDTAGASQKDAEMIGELVKVYKAGVPMDVHLIVSATTSDEDLADISTRYRALPLASLIVSKLDESNRFGGVYNLMHETHLPYSYFTIGQSVPDDIEAATPERVADLLLSISAQ